MDSCNSPQAGSITGLCSPFQGECITPCARRTDFDHRSTLSWLFLAICRHAVHRVTRPFVVVRIAIGVHITSVVGVVRVAGAPKATTAQGISNTLIRYYKSWPYRSRSLLRHFEMSFSSSIIRPVQYSTLLLSSPRFLYAISINVNSASQLPAASTWSCLLKM